MLGLVQRVLIELFKLFKLLDTSFGTDSEAFSQIAHDYFFGPVSPHDPDSDCQLNYVIVIGDGMMSGTGTASDRGMEGLQIDLQD